MQTISSQLLDSRDCTHSALIGELSAILEHLIPGIVCRVLRRRPVRSFHNPGDALECVSVVDSIKFIFRW